MEYPIQFLPLVFDLLQIQTTMSGWILKVNWTEFDEDGHTHKYAEYEVDKFGFQKINGDTYPFTIEIVN